MYGGVVLHYIIIKRQQYRISKRYFPCCFLWTSHYCTHRLLIVVYRTLFMFIISPCINGINLIYTPPNSNQLSQPTTLPTIICWHNICIICTHVALVGAHPRSRELIVRYYFYMLHCFISHHHASQSDTSGLEYLKYDYLTTSTHWGLKEDDIQNYCVDILTLFRSTADF